MTCKIKKDDTGRCRELKSSNNLYIGVIMPSVDIGMRLCAGPSLVHCKFSMQASFDLRAWRYYVRETARQTRAIVGSVDWTTVLDLLVHGVALASLASGGGHLLAWQHGVGVANVAWRFLARRYEHVAANQRGTRGER